VEVQLDGEATDEITPARATARSLPLHWRKGTLIGEGSFGKVYRGLNTDTGACRAVLPPRWVPRSPCVETLRKHCCAAPVAVVRVAPRVWPAAVAMRPRVVSVPVVRMFVWRVGGIIAVKEVPLVPRATKVRGANDDESRRRCVDELMKEVNMMRNLKHRHIVRYLGAQLEPDRLFVLLENVPGTYMPPACLHMLAHACTCLHMLAHACTCLHMLAHACTCLHMLAHACTCSRLRNVGCLELPR
jgi:serine/threonine protein kinase